MAENERGNYQRVSPIKPNLRGAGNWTRAQFRAASYSRKAMLRLVGSILVTMAVLIYVALWMGGLLPAVKTNIHNFNQSRLMAAGFVVKDIDIVGEGRLRERDVRTALGIYEGQYFFGADLAAAQSRVENLNWVENVVVRRLWPNRIVVEIIERDVFALWQHQGKLAVIDPSGVIIESAAAQDYSGLPHFIGENIAGNGPDILAALAQYPELSRRFTTLRRLGDRRWDIIDMSADMTIKLPETNIDAALKKVMAYHHQTQWLDRKIDMIDLRVAGRISIRPHEFGQS
jgi:cell division protein FtsQ